MLLEIVFTITFGLAALCIFAYYVRTGQFDASEEVKYQIFHDDVPPEKSDKEEV